MIPVYRDIDVKAVYNIAVSAGNAILQVYNTVFSVEHKADYSPLTEADKQSHLVIKQGLTELDTKLPLLSEESKPEEYVARQSWQRFWLVDPLDGTKEFIKRNGDFTVNIALIEKGKPVVGVVYVPVAAIGYIGIIGQGAYKIEKGVVKQIEQKQRAINVVRVVASRSHLSPETEEYIRALVAQGKQVAFISRGSSIKLCMVAEGAADIYPRFAPTMEWDTAAAQAVVEAAGKSVLAYPEGIPLQYNKENLLNPWFIVQ